MREPESLGKLKLGAFPTPVQYLGNMNRLLGINLYVKRDDLSGLGLGGNKVRKLEYLLADALRKGAHTVFTTGGAQSNHAMLTAAACAKLGLASILMLKKRGVTEKRGNQLLNQLIGTRVIFIDTDDYADIYAEMDDMAQRGGDPSYYYKIPCGGSNALGTLGYVDCAKELASSGTHFDHIVCAEGSGGTMAGITLGAKLYLPGTRVHGMMVDTDPFDIITQKLMAEAAELLETDVKVSPEEYELMDMCGPGYARPSNEGREAIELMASLEGIFLDPVYTGKAFAGLIKLAREGRFRKDENVLFIHTGGAGGLFAVDM